MELHRNIPAAEDAARRRDHIFHHIAAAPHLIRLVDALFHVHLLHQLLHRPLQCEGSAVLAEDDLLRELALHLFLHEANGLLPAASGHVNSLNPHTAEDSLIGADRNRTHRKEQQHNSERNRWNQQRDIPSALSSFILFSKYTHFTQLQYRSILECYTRFLFYSIFPTISISISKKAKDAYFIIIKAAAGEDFSSPAAGPLFQSSISTARVGAQEVFGTFSGSAVNFIRPDFTRSRFTSGPSIRIFAA